MIDERSAMPPSSGGVLHITNIPTPYRLPLYIEIRRQLAEQGIDFHVFFLGRNLRHREWKVSVDEMAQIDHSVADPSRSTVAQIIERIEATRPIAVVTAWAFDQTALRVMLHCKRNKIPCLAVTGETKTSFARETKRALRTLVRQPFFKLMDGFVTYGSVSESYLIDSGVRREKITRGINVVDTLFFRDAADEERRSGRAQAERDRYRMPDGSPFSLHLLHVGEFQPYKGVIEMLEAYVRLGRSDVALHLVGSGPFEEEVRGYVERNSLGDRVFFHGYRQKRELPLYYAMADILLFPSMWERFGLVLVEGVASGLPVIATSVAGATPDVVIDGENGIVVYPPDTQQFTDALARLVGDAELRERMGRAAREHAERHLTPNRSARCYIEGLDRATRARSGAGILVEHR